MRPEGHILLSRDCYCVMIRKMLLDVEYVFNKNVLQCEEISYLPSKPQMEDNTAESSSLKQRFLPCIYSSVFFSIDSRE